MSDRLGRRPVLPRPECLQRGTADRDVQHDGERHPVQALFGALALACVAGGVSAVGAVATAEQFPGEGRLSGLALGATVATADSAA